MSVEAAEPVVLDPELVAARISEGQMQLAIMQERCAALAVQLAAMRRTLAATQAVAVRLEAENAALRSSRPDDSASLAAATAH